MTLLECKRCLARFRMNEHGALARALDEEARAAKPDRQFVCGDCDHGAAGFDRTRVRNADGYTSVRGRYIDGLGRKR